MKLLTFAAATGLLFAFGCTGLTGEEESDDGGGILGGGDDSKDTDVDDTDDEDVDKDSDGDGLTDADEADLGTDADEADSDGDGTEDGAEIEQNTDPLDEDSHPFEGGWPISACNGDLEGEGYGKGDISTDWSMKDQFGEEVNLHAFCDNVVYMVFAAFW